MEDECSEVEGEGEGKGKRNIINVESTQLIDCVKKNYLVILLLMLFTPTHQAHYLFVLLVVGYALSSM